MLSNAGKNTMLDNWGGDFLSAHTTWPGDTGANETSGGSPAYARKSGTFGAASNGSRSLSSPVVFDIATGQTIRWIGRWSASSGGTFRGAQANNGSDKEFVVDTATDIVTVPSHGYADTQKIAFYNGTPPGGLTEGTVYFVRDSTTNTFKVAATSGGAAIDLTSNPAAGCVVSAITEEVFGSQGTLTCNTFTQNLNG